MGEKSRVTPPALLARQLRDRLAEIDQAFDDAVDGAWAAHPLVGLLLEAQQRAQQVVDELVRRRKTHGLDRVVVMQLRQAKVALREAKDAVRAAKDRASPELGPVFAAAAQRRKEDVKAARREACAAGLDADACNAIVAHHNSARRLSVRLRGGSVVVARSDGDGD